MVVELVRSKIKIFYALPMLGFAVGSLLGRDEAGEPDAAAQMQWFGKKLVRLRAKEQAAMAGPGFMHHDPDTEEEEEADDEEEQRKDQEDEAEIAKEETEEEVTDEEEGDALTEGPGQLLPSDLVVLSKAEVRQELLRVWEATNVQAFMATLLAPSFEQLAEGVRVHQDQATSVMQEVRACHLGLDGGVVFPSII